MRHKPMVLARPRAVALSMVLAALLLTSDLPHPVHLGPGDRNPSFRPADMVTTSSSDAAPDASTQIRVHGSYGTLPLSFEANHGQTDNQVKFIARGRGYTLFLTSSEAVLALRQPHTTAQNRRSSPALFPAAADSPPPPAPTVEEEQGGGGVVRMQLVGANHAAQVVGLDELPGKVNYFLGNDPTKWRTNIPTYAKVQYWDVYPGVSLVYYGRQGQLEYDFVLAPGVAPGVIRLAFEDVGGVNGGSPLHIDAQGALMLQTAGGALHLHQPRIYQEIDGVKQAIAGGYVLLSRHPQESHPQSPLPVGEGQGEGRYQLGFQVAAYDTSRPLIIDPVLSYSTYLGGSGTDTGVSIAVDATGQAYVTGSTDSIDFPTSLGAFDAGCGTDGNCNPFKDFFRQEVFGNFDVFVTKLNATGAAPIYSTYLGGSQSDTGAAIAVDATGHAYVTGSTGSRDFPTTPRAFQPACSGGLDTFVTELAPAGDGLVYSTCLLGSGSFDPLAGRFDTARGSGIAVDAAGDAYLTGATDARDFPTTPGAFQSTCFGPPGDAFVAKLNALGSALVYSTCLGGRDIDSGGRIAVDPSGHAYVTGSTGSRDFPTTPGAFQPVHPGRPGAFVQTAFVTQLTPAGDALVYSTYLGGGLGASVLGLAVDTSGNAYVTGQTFSVDFPTVHPFQATCSRISFGPCLDAFVTKLHPAGSALVYSTYLGGNSDDQGSGIAVDTAGQAYVTGQTSSRDFPTTAGVFQTTYGGGVSDAFVTKLHPAGSALVYSTYLGGNSDDRGFGIAVDAAGNAYVTGQTLSLDFPTVSSFQPAFRGGSVRCSGGPPGPLICINGGDTFMAKIAATVDLSLSMTGAPDPVTVGDHLTYAIAVVNQGADSATQVVLTDSLPEGVTLVSATSSQGSCSGTSTVICTLGMLGSGASAEIDIVVTPTVVGTLSNIATVTTSVSDPDATNNRGAVTTTVTAPPSRGGSDGGCALNPGGGFDPMLVGVLGLMLAYVGWTRLRRRSPNEPQAGARQIRADTAPASTTQGCL